MKRATDVLIIGGGVIGCSIAYFLAKEGRQVEVVERGKIGAQASSAAAGLLAPLLPSSSSPEFIALLLASFALFPSLTAELEDTSGISIGFTQTGALRTASSSKGFRRLAQVMSSWQSRGFHVALLTQDEVHTIEPELAPGIRGAIHAPEESQLRAPALVTAFARAAARKGVLLSEQTEIVGIKSHNGRVTGVLTAQGDIITCRQLVIASGAWSEQGGQWLSLKVPVRPVRGQVILLRQPLIPVRHIIFGEGVYLAPKPDNTVLVGATKDDVGFTTTVTPEGIAWLRAAAGRLVPALVESELVTAWAGLRPKTLDGFPILGAAPQWDNVIVSTGHNAFGVTLCAITAQLITQLLMTGHTPDMLSPFSPLRFHEAQAEACVTPVA